MKLAMPKPCGMRSTHKWNADVCSFHRLASTLARMAMAQDTSVSVYSFPVRRMSLRAAVARVRIAPPRVRENTHQPAKTLPVEIAI